MTSHRGSVLAVSSCPAHGTVRVPAPISRSMQMPRKVPPPAPAVPFFTARAPGHGRQALAFRTQDSMWRPLPAGGEGRGPPGRYNTFKRPHEDRFAWKRFRNPPGVQPTVFRDKMAREPKLLSYH